MPNNFESLLTHFKVQKQKDNSAQVYCPVHDDKNASVTITFTGDKALIFCHAGCHINDILKAVNLTVFDLFYDNKNKPTAIYQYRNVDNTLNHEKLKYKRDKGKTFSQRHILNGEIVENIENVNKVPYNYPEVVKAIKEGALVLYVEGEKDADTARLLGFTATTMGGASDWKADYTKHFKDACIGIIPDKDSAGLSLTNKMTEDLMKVCRSLKTIILPTGKDLTEWVEQGNSNLSDLISNSQDIIKFNGIIDPVIEKIFNGYSFKWDSLNLVVKVDRLTDDSTGIIKVIDSGHIIHTANINLLSTRSLSELTNRLSKQKKIEWDVILSKISNYCINSLEDSGIDEDISLEPTTMKVEYLLEPILPLNEPVTIFTAGGKGKSILADYFCVLVQNGICPNGDLPFIPRKANVLYLDWEADAETHRRYITAIKRGLGLDVIESMHYRRLDHPLCKVIDTIKELVSKYDIGLVVIDSQMAATAGGTQGLTEAQVASEYYNNIRALGCSTLTIDHITKQGMASENNNDAPYGSVVKYNRSRSQFELKLPEEEENSDRKEFALVHKKFNLGRKQKPIGIVAEFVNEGDTLIKVTFDKCELSENPVLQKILPRITRIVNAIKDLGGKAHVKDIAEAIGESDKENIITAQLNRDKKRFVALGKGVYGLAENRQTVLTDQSEQWYNK